VNEVFKALKSGEGGRGCPRKEGGGNRSIQGKKEGSGERSAQGGLSLGELHRKKL